MNDKETQGSSSDVVPCPACNATGEMFVTGLKYAEGHSGPYCRTLPCSDCGGTKVILAIMLEWRERGSEIRRWRRSSKLTLHEAGHRSGLSPSEVSALEWGRVDNANWRDLLKVGQVDNRCYTCSHAIYKGRDRLMKCDKRYQARKSEEQERQESGGNLRTHVAIVAGVAPHER